MNFLFWNIHKSNAFYNVISAIAEHESIDVLALAEFPKDSQQEIVSLLEHLNVNGLQYEYLEPIKKEKVFIFFKKGHVNISNKYNGDRLCAKEIKAKGNKYSFVFCHLPSVFGTNMNELRNSAQDFCEEIIYYEEDIARHNNTIVCGDLNMSPFDVGMIDAKCFNATMDVNIANKLHRKVHNKQYMLFYNPMWNLLGDNFSGKTPGTYYLNNSQYTNMSWHLLDQVIIRPGIIPIFDGTELKIVTESDSHNLLNADGKLDSNYSDHLPIKFKINI